MIVGHGMGSGTLSVPYLASRNRWYDILWIVAAVYGINLVLHFMIAELSYNNGSGNRHSPEGKKSLKALNENIDTYNRIYDAAKENRKMHNSVVAFAPDHGCHRQFGFLGSQGKDEPCDRNVMHLYGFLPRSTDLSKAERKE